MAYEAIAVREDTPYGNPVQQGSVDLPFGNPSGNADPTVVPSWRIAVTRGADGNLTGAELFEDGTSYKSWTFPLVGLTAAYDDATPIAAGSYSSHLKTDSTKGTNAAPGYVIHLDGIVGRNSIELHNGNFTYDSEGCFVVPQMVLNDIVSRMLERYSLAGFTESGGAFPNAQAIGFDVIGAVQQPKVSFNRTTLATNDRTSHSIGLNINLSDAEHNGISKTMVVKFRVDLNSKVTTGDFTLSDYIPKNAARDQNDPNRHIDALKYLGKGVYEVVLETEDRQADLRLTINKNSNKEGLEHIKFKIIDVDLYNAPTRADPYDENGSGILNSLFIDRSKSVFTLAIAADPKPPRMVDYNHVDHSGDQHPASPHIAGDFIL